MPSLRTIGRDKIYAGVRATVGFKQTNDSRPLPFKVGQRVLITKRSEEAIVEEVIPACGDRHYILSVRGQRRGGFYTRKQLEPCE